MITVFERKSMKIQFFLFGRKTDLYFHDCTLAIKRNEKSDKDGDVTIKLEDKKQLKSSLIVNSEYLIQISLIIIFLRKSI